ncbi:potassium channel family protein [Demequina sediminicola]|uniref:potassium channel family protein n=1 Tax=Demequina sediminicola TaxID=1095026 RepID=UPI000AEFA4F0|nr:potassium channel family protein [Demequina sediminicola]
MSNRHHRRFSVAMPRRHRDAPIRNRWVLGILLASLVLLQFGYPITLEGPIWTIVYLLTYTGVLYFGVRISADDPGRYWAVMIASLLLTAAGVWFAIQQEDSTAEATFIATIGLLQLTLLIALGAVLLSPPPKVRSVDLILVAVSAYLLLGGVFGSIASLLEYTSPGSYLDTQAVDGVIEWHGLFYYSYVTLSTLGYGDVVPVAPWARSLGSLEAVMGTLFVAVVIARLVGIARRPERDA